MNVMNEICIELNGLEFEWNGLNWYGKFECALIGKFNLNEYLNEWYWIVMEGLI